MAARRSKNAQDSRLKNTETADGISPQRNTYQDKSVYRGKVLLACVEGADATDALLILEQAGFAVTWVKDGREAVNEFARRATGGRLDATEQLKETGGGGGGSADKGDENGIDCLVVQKDLPLANAFQVIDLP